MKHLKLYSLLFLAAFFLNSCRNPAYELDLMFDADVIAYKATIVLRDANNAALPANLTVKVEGADAASIYDFSGSKQIYAPGGVITLGVTPKANPTAAKSLNFNVLISGAGYEDINIPVTIVVDQFNQVMNVTLLKVATATAVTSVATGTAVLNASATTTSVTTVTTPGTGTVLERASVTVPAGVQMQNAAAAPLNGARVTVNVLNYEAKDPATIALFPGGSYAAPNVMLEGGAAGSAFFIPAGFTRVKMFVDAQEVKKFSAPININIAVDPTFKPAATDALVKVGDLLKVYSYDVLTGQFKFEASRAVSLNAFGKLAVDFPVNHLTTFIVGDVFVTTTCVTTKATLLAPWLNGGSQPMNVEILNADGSRVLARAIAMAENTSLAFWRGLPGIALTYRLKNNNGETLATGAMASPCAGTALNITLTPPAGQANPNITLDLNVICPGKGNVIVPNFDLFYKPAGAPNSAYQLLGTVKKGRLITSLIMVGKLYDFKAGWKNEVKAVGGRLITSQDMSVYVGDNNFLGSNPTSEFLNRALLVEACKTYQ